MRRVIPVLAMSPLLAIAVAGAQTRPSVAGVWRFQKEVDRKADGSYVSVGPRQGYRGMLILTADGYMSGTIMPFGRRWTVPTASIADFRETVETGTAYSGPYHVDPTSRTITIEVVSSMDPQDEGTEAKRQYALNGDTLRLTGTWRFNGEKLTFTNTFIRIK